MNSLSIALTSCFTFLKTIIVFQQGSFVLTSWFNGSSSASSTNCCIRHHIWPYRSFVHSNYIRCLLLVFQTQASNIRNAWVEQCCVTYWKLLRRCSSSRTQVFWIFRSSISGVILSPLINRRHWVFLNGKSS